MMNSLPRLQCVYRRLGGVTAAHLVIAVIALVVIGGATRVMEASAWPVRIGPFASGRSCLVAR